MEHNSKIILFCWILFPINYIVKKKMSIKFNFLINQMLLYSICFVLIDLNSISICLGLFYTFL